MRTTLFTPFKFAWLSAAVLTITWVATSATPACAGATIAGIVTIAGSQAATAHPDDVVVSVAGLHYPATDGKVRTETLSLDQKDLRFVPHVLPVPVGTQVTFHNHDSVLHNVHSESTINQPFNFAIMKNRTRNITFEKPEVVHIRCDVHSEMSAYIVVEDNPFYARPGKDGHFTIAGVPPGTYTIRAWHEKAGTAEQRVTLVDGGSVTADLTLGK